MNSEERNTEDRTCPTNSKWGEERGSSNQEREGGIQLETPKEKKEAGGGARDA